MFQRALLNTCITTCFGLNPSHQVLYAETLLRTKDCCTHSLLHVQQDALTQYKDSFYKPENGKTSCGGHVHLWIHLASHQYVYRVSCAGVRLCLCEHIASRQEDVRTNSSCDYRCFIRKNSETTHCKKGWFFMGGHEQNRNINDIKVDNKRCLNSSQISVLLNNVQHLKINY
jgi:hypothetical protein